MAGLGRTPDRGVQPKSTQVYLGKIYRLLLTVGLGYVERVCGAYLI